MVWRCRDGVAEIARGADVAAETLSTPETGAALDSLARPDRRDTLRPARGPAADGRRPVRRVRLRHGSAAGAAGRAQSRSARPARRRPDPPVAGGHLRFGAARDRRMVPPPSPTAASTPTQPVDAADARLDDFEARLRRPLLARGARRADCRARLHARRSTAPAIGDLVARGQGLHRRRRHLPGRAQPPLRARRGRAIPSPSTARCAARTPRPTCSSSTSATSSWPAPAPRSSSG